MNLNVNWSICVNFVAPFYMYIYFLYEQVFLFLSNNVVTATFRQVELLPVLYGEAVF